MTGERFPLLRHGVGAPVARWQGRTVERETFLAHAALTAAGLPAHAGAISLCRDRYLFLVAFAAALIRGQTTLLPGNGLDETVRALRDAYPDSYAVRDADLLGLLRDAGHPADGASKARPRGGGDAVPKTVPGGGTDDAIAQIAAGHIAAIAFTSGSTGRPKAAVKTWGSLVIGARLAARRFTVAPATTLVATVPPQHMYGLETSIMLPLYAQACVDGGRPLFPADVAAALAAQPDPRVLITTPTHLRACVGAGAGVDWPALALVVSATAPLDAALAARAERVFGAPVMEIYGFSEAGSVASRRTVAGAVWRTYDGVKLSAADRGGEADPSAGGAASTLRADGPGAVYSVSGGHLDAPVPLSDRLRVHDAQTFTLLGRDEDMVNVAGKRASLSDLSLSLNAIDGVLDGAFVAPADDADGPDARARRLVALVVAPRLSVAEVRAALAQRVDPAFLPRPLYKVDALPRNDAGKLPRRALDELLAALRGRPPRR